MSAPDQLTPNEDVGTSPEQELDAMEASLDLEAADPDDLIVTADELPALGRGWRFDFAGPGFVRGSRRGSPLETRGLATLQVWIEKCLRTERESSPIHAVGYGLEGAYAGFGQHPENVALADLEARVTDALTFHPRITAVEGFTTDYDPDEEYLAVAFIAVLDDDTRLQIGLTF